MAFVTADMEYEFVILMVLEDNRVADIGACDVN
jgi:hypothetical protein